jgi:hypothetical protein
MINHSTNDSHLPYLTTYRFSNKIRFGNKKDGGYVCANLPPYDAFISIGVGYDESFSSDFIGHHKISKEHCFAFDGTIDVLPSNYPIDKLTFVNKNIGIINDEKTDTLDYLYNKYSNIFIKMDIEGYEYDYILSLTKEKLQKIKQIIFEIHGINDNGFYGDNNEIVVGGYEGFQNKVDFFKKMIETHYLIHVHANNGGGRTYVNGILIPNVIEVTYVRKDIFIKPPILNNIPFPVANLDCQSYHHLDEFPTLNYPPFCHL